MDYEENHDAAIQDDNESDGGSLSKTITRRSSYGNSARARQRSHRMDHVMRSKRVEGDVQNNRPSWKSTTWW